jgi:CubicO group peptidase (beta-lactamase class C family)/lipoprotein NlpI
MNREYRSHSYWWMIVLAVILLCLASTECRKKDEGSGAIMIDSPQTRRIDALVKEHVELYKPVGLALGVMKNNEFLYAKGFGVKNINNKSPVTPESVFHMASVSKPFTAIAVMQLVEKGILNLDSPVVHYLPYFKLDDARYKDITLRHILSHTSGIPDVEDEDDYEWENPQNDSLAVERFVKSLARRKLQFNPGERRSYSNFAYNVLPDVVAKAAHMDFEAYMEKHIFAPCEMSHSTFLKQDIPPKWAVDPHEINTLRLDPMVSPIYPYSRMNNGSSNLQSNILDMGNFSRALLNGGVYKEVQILKSSTIEKMANERLGWSGYWEFEGHKALSYAGSDRGFNSYHLVLPEDSVAVVAMSNCDHFICTDICQEVLRILLNVEPREPKPPLSAAFQESIREQGIARALEILDDWMEKEKDRFKVDIDNIWFLGWRAIQQGNNDLAIDILKFWLKLYPNSDFAHYALGKANLQKGARDEALKHFEILLEQDPDHYRAKKYLLELNPDPRRYALYDFSRYVFNELLPSKDTERAYSIISAYHRIYPDFWKSWSDLGRYHFMNGEYDKALENFEKAERLSPDNSFLGDFLQLVETVKYTDQLMTAYQGKGFEEMRLLLDKSKARAPLKFESDSLNSLGYRMIANDKLNEALKIFKLNILLHPDYANGYDSLGEAYLLAGQNELAAQSYRKAIELDPDMSSSRKALEKIYARAGRRK